MNTKAFRLLLLVMLGSQTAFTISLFDDNSESNTPQLDEGKTIKSNVSLKSTFCSQHMWRGFAVGTAPTIEPLITYSYGNFKANAWAAFAIDNSYREIDFFITYDWKYVRLGLYDYYCPQEGSLIVDFTRFKSTETQHLFEAQAVIKGGGKIPLKLTTACFIGGSDIDGNGKQLYSTYLELAYSFSKWKNNFSFEVGMTPFEGMYASHASVFNYGFSVARDININDHWSIPSLYKLVYNKEKKDVYFTVGFTFR
jgi:hypothetical protein